MFGTYLRRELAGRRRQTAIIAIGMGLAIALVIIVNAVSGGIQQAQATVLKSVYGVGTDVTVTQKASTATAGGPQQFGFGTGDGSTSGGTQSIATARLSTAIGSTAFSSSALSTVKSVANVKSATATLSLTNTAFTGTLPTFTQNAQGGRPTAPTGGADGNGGSSFSVDSFTVMGLSPTATAVGPLSSVKLTSGKSFTSSDADSNVAILDSTYATSTKTKYKVGDSISIAGTDFSVIGIVSSTSSSAATASNVYIPLTVAQTLSSNKGKVTGIYVSAASSADITAVKAGIEKALPKTTVSTQADLASSVSGSLATASSLLSNLGTWLSVIVLAAAFLIAILFTISGVTRRTREFGTLKAIGWSNRRIVGQVAGESLVQGLIGGVAGVAVGVIGIFVVNALNIKLGASTAAASPVARSLPAGAPSGAPGGGGGGLPSFGAAATSATTNVILSASVTVWIVVIAVALAVLGGLLAGAIGGWRASRLRPAEALRSIA